MKHEWALQSGFLLLITLISSMTSNGFISCFKPMYLKIIRFRSNTNLGKGWWYLHCNGYPLRFQQYISLTEINRKFFISGIAIRPKRIRVYNSYYLTGTSLSFTGWGGGKATRNGKWLFFITNHLLSTCFSYALRLRLQAWEHHHCRNTLPSHLLHTLLRALHVMTKANRMYSRAKWELRDRFTMSDKAGETSGSPPQVSHFQIWLRPWLWWTSPH